MPFEWTAGTEAVVVAIDVLGKSDYFMVPWANLPEFLAIPMTQKRQSNMNHLAGFSVAIGDGVGPEDNDDLFSWLTKGDIGLATDEDEDGVNEDDPLDANDKKQVLECIEQFAQDTKCLKWSKIPNVIVRTCGVLQIHFK